MTDRERERRLILAQIGPGLAHDLLNLLLGIEGVVRMVIASPDNRDVHALLINMEADLRQAKRRLWELDRIAKPRCPSDLFVPVDLGSVAEEVLAQPRENDEIQLGLRITDPVSPILGNPEDIKRVISHLVQNALAAMKGRSGRVRISVADRQPNHLMLSIADSGVGIPADRLTGLGSDFWTLRRNGIGLGLPLVSRIVEDMGGSVLFESTVGVGTTVTLTLPSAPAICPCPGGS